MVHHSKTAFTFGPEFRARIREVGKRRGFKLCGMTLLMHWPGTATPIQRQSCVGYGSVLSDSALLRNLRIA